MCHVGAQKGARDEMGAKEKGVGGLGRNWAVEKQHGTGVEGVLQPCT
jgi:hypothetical protein